MFNSVSNDGYRKYLELRKDFPVFVFRGFDLEKGQKTDRLVFRFETNGGYSFNPSWQLDMGGAGSQTLERDEEKILLFHIGMTEMISYWKAFCSPRIVIEPYILSYTQQQWWKKLFLKGLGEFFYTNGIPQPGEELLTFEFSPGAAELPVIKESTGREADSSVLLPLGGGKDSVVGTEILLDGGYGVLPFVINPRGATEEVIRAAGLEEGRVIRIYREIDPELIKLNEKGFLNGHTPFSALLAFASYYAARKVLAGSIALSNESSANEPSIPGTGINHQYSKSLEFEKDFREYADMFLGGGTDYFSLLRPLNELQIGALFAGLEKYHTVFKSCNAGSKENRWCAKCSKCLFTFIILSPFISKDGLIRIFGSDLFEDVSLRPLLDQLCGIADNKPLECVGTIEEVNAALRRVISLYKDAGRELPELLNYYYSTGVYSDFDGKDFQELLDAFDGHHCLKTGMEKIVRQYAGKLGGGTNITKNVK